VNGGVWAAMASTLLAAFSANGVIRRLQLVLEDGFCGIEYLFRRTPNDAS
jgi:hypothetical protein